METCWETYRHTLRTLYILENRSLPSIIAYMNETYGFDKKKGQYERRFTAWGFRKNSTSEDWKIVHGKIDKRDRRGKASVVYRSGKKVQAGKLKKEKRHLLLEHAETYEPEDPPTPQKFTVCTPLGDLDSAPFIHINNIPSLKLFRRLQSCASVAPFDSLMSPVFDRSLYPQDNFGDLGLTNLVDMMPQLPLSPGDQSPVSPYRNWPLCLESMDSVIHMSYENNIGTSLERFRTSHYDERMQLLLSMLHLASNNLLSRTKAMEVWQLVQEANNHSLLNTLLSDRSPAAKALARTFLPVAVRSSHVLSVKMLLDAGIDPDSPMDYRGTRPLMFAVRERSVALVQLLLSRGANINPPVQMRRYGDDYTPLQQAVLGGDLQLVQICLQARADVNITTIENDKPIRRRHSAQTPLQLAAEMGHLDIARALLQYRADVNKSAPGHFTALQSAVRGRQPDLILLFIQAGADVNALPSEMREGSTALHLAIVTGQVELVRYLLRQGSNVNALASDGKRTALHAAADVGSLDLVRLLVLAGADIKQSPMQPGAHPVLHYAVRSRCVQLVQHLLASGADPNATVPATDHTPERTALEEATRKGDLEIVQLLLSSGASNTLPALKAAADLGQMEIVRVLMHTRSGSNVSRVDAHARTALRAAARHGDLALVRYLLKDGADVNARVAPGDDTALQAACRGDDFAIVELLLLSGADINAPPGLTCGVTALQAAAWKDDINLVEYLLHHGADVHALAAQYGHMALEAAASKNNHEMCKTLLRAGADAMDEDHPAVLQAVELGSLELTRLLLESCVSEDGICWQRDKYGGGALEAAVSWQCEIPYPKDFELTVCLDLVQLLLSYGADDKSEALRMAVDHGRFEIAKLLCDAGANVNAIPTHPGVIQSSMIQLAAQSKQFGMAKLLIDHGANVHQQTQALQVAAGHNIEMVRLLLNAGADVNSPPVAGFDEDEGVPRTALQEAAACGQIDIVRLLLDHGADMEQEATHEAIEATALQFAVIDGNLSIVELLLQRGADVNAPPMGEKGRTALEGAAEHGRLDLVQLLINVEAETHGSRALNFARKEGHDGVIQLLLENGFKDESG